MSLIAGIDLGTTNSLLGVMEAGFPVLIAGADGERITPSVVYFPEEGDPVVGRAASRMRALQPSRTVYSVKRYMGRRGGEEPADVSYPIDAAPGRPVRIPMGDRFYSAEEVSSLVLRKLRADVERALACEVTRAVITVPAYFNDAQRNATKTAGEMAGFQVERILNEPTAAALAYGMERLGDQSKIAVYDLGGGTFDISILELNQGVFQVLSTNGDTRLGGDDIDSALTRWLRERLIESGADPAELSDARIREVAIEVKHQLSDVDSVEAQFPFVSGSHSAAARVTRAELNRLAKPTVERTREHCLRALSDANVRPEELHAILLVGGQTRMPLVREFVERFFGKEPNTTQNPDEAVAIGATIQAGILSGSVQNVVLLDVTPLSLGIETFGGLMNVIIPRNSTIPCKAGEMFTNAMPGQRAMLINVLQGEREMARDNWPLGKFELEFEPAPKGQARVGVQFEIDANGILHVLARDTKTGAEKVVKMASAVDVSDEAVEKMLEESLEHAFEDVNERAFTEAKLKAEQLLPLVRRSLEKAGASLGDEERQVIEQRMEAVRAAIATGAAHALQRANSALDEATEHLAVVLIEQARAASPSR